jgi:hypothetical protein
MHILVLDDLRAFTDSDGVRFSHVRSVDAALALMDSGASFDVVFLDYDLSATERHSTALRFAQRLADVNYDGLVVTITDLEDGALDLLRAFRTAVVSDIGARWNSHHLGLDRDDTFVERVTARALAEGIIVTREHELTVSL